MARSRSALEIEARAAATRRGHDLGAFTSDGMRVGAASAECLRTSCEAYVIVETRPAPNGIDIGGSAVALECPVRAGSWSLQDR